MSGEFVVSLVLSHHSKNLKWWMDQWYSSVLLGKQRKLYPWGMRVGRHAKRRENPMAQFWLLIFYVLLPLSVACVNWASQESCLFHLRFSLWSLDLPLFYFHSLFPPPFWTPLSYSKYLTYLKITMHIPQLKLMLLEKWLIELLDSRLLQTFNLLKKNIVSEQQSAVKWIMSVLSYVHGL